MIDVKDVLDLIPGGHKVFIGDGDSVCYFEGRACDVPDECMALQVAYITAYDWCIDIEVYAKEER